MRLLLVLETRKKFSSKKFSILCVQTSLLFNLSVMGVTPKNELYFGQTNHKLLLLLVCFIPVITSTNGDQ